MWSQDAGVVLLLFSQLLIRSCAPSATPATQGEKPGSSEITWKAWQQGACDLLEEDLNSTLFNVFLERRAFPPGDDVDGAYMT